MLSILEDRKLSSPLATSESYPCLQWYHVLKPQGKKARCIHLLLCLFLPVSVSRSVSVVPPPPRPQPQHCHTYTTHSPVSVLLSLLCLFTVSVFVGLLVCLSLLLAGAIHSALLIQGQSVLSLGWCQTLERGVLWKLNLDSSPNHTSVMLSIWPPVCPLNIRSLTLPITCLFPFWSGNKHFFKTGSPV